MPLPSMLVLELRMLGDAVMSIPFVRGAMTRYDVSVCCLPGSVPVYSTLLPRDRIITWIPPWLRRQCDAHAADLGTSRAAILHFRHMRPDVAVSVWADTRLHLMMASSRAKIRAGLPMNRRNCLAADRPWRKRQLFIGQCLDAFGSIACLRPLLTCRINRADGHQSLVENWHQLADELDLPWDPSPPWLPLPALPVGDGYDQIRRLVSAAHAANQKVWVIHAGARAPARRWSIERLQELIDTLFLPQHIPTIIIKPPDGPCPSPRNNSQALIETKDFSALCSIVGCADAVLCNDSLAAHVGAALGKQVVTIFGPGDYHWFAPYGNGDFVVKADVCPHHPCIDRCEMPSYVCIESVTVDMVRKTIERLDPAACRRFHH